MSANLIRQLKPAILFCRIQLLERKNRLDLHMLACLVWPYYSCEISIIEFIDEVALCFWPVLSYSRILD